MNELIPHRPHKLGRKPRTYDPRIPHMSAVRRHGALVAPASCDYTSEMPASLGMMLNDSLGDCTAAAVGHAQQVWTFNAGAQMITPPDAVMVVPSGLRQPS